MGEVRIGNISKRERINLNEKEKKMMHTLAHTYRCKFTFEIPFNFTICSNL